MSYNQIKKGNRTSSKGRVFHISLLSSLDYSTVTFKVDDKMYISDSLEDTCEEICLLNHVGPPTNSGGSHKPQHFKSNGGRTIFNSGRDPLMVFSLLLSVADCHFLCLYICMYEERREHTKHKTHYSLLLFPSPCYKLCNISNVSSSSDSGSVLGFLRPCFFPFGFPR